MSELFFFLVSSAGLTNILVYGTIFDRVRPKYHFFHCMMCMGFWSGVALFLLGAWQGLFNADMTLVSAIMHGFAGSASSYTFGAVIDDDGIKTNRSKK